MSKIRQFLFAVISAGLFAPVFVGCGDSQIEEDCEFICNRGAECTDGTGGFDSVEQCITECSGAAEVSQEFDPECESLSRAYAVCSAAIACDDWDDDDVIEAECGQEAEAFNNQCVD